MTLTLQQWKHCTCMATFHWLQPLLIRNFYRLLLPIQLSRARLTFLLECAGGRFLLTQSSKNERLFLAQFWSPPEQQDMEIFNATVGEQMTVVGNNKQVRVFFVRGIKKYGLVIHYPDKSGFTKSSSSAHDLTQDRFLNGARDLQVSATFQVAELKYKVLETAAIDGLTACGTTWFQGKRMDCRGCPMVISSISCTNLCGTLLQSLNLFISIFEHRP
jgi:hypothetical protein